MKILALDTTGLCASAAIVSDEKVLAEIITDCKKNHSQTIMPMIADILQRIETDISQIDYIACTSGPGSFTGLRIGAATAKGLCFGQNKKIIPVPALDALAYNIIRSDCVIAPLMDARREQVYTAFYEWDHNELVRLTGYDCQNIDLVLENLKPYTKVKNAVFTGDGIQPYATKLMRVGFVVPPHTSRIRASTVGSLALKRVEYAIDASAFEPFYIRKPQAERERECIGNTN